MSNSTLDGYDGFLSGSLANIMRPVVFVKTHKTGSSTLANIMHRLGDIRDMRFLLPVMDNMFLGWPSAFPGRGVEEPSLGAPVDLIVNHAVYNGAIMRAYMRSPPFFVTLLRDPSTQSVSAYNYFSGGVIDIDWESHLAWLEAEARPGSDAVAEAMYLNPQAHDLGWYEFVGQTRAHDRDAAKIEEWLDELDLDFVVHGLVILAEHFDSGLVMLQRHLGCDLRELRYVRLKPAEKKIEPNEAQLQRLLNVSGVDVALYSHFEHQHMIRWNEGNLTRKNADLMALKRYNIRLHEACGDDQQASVTCPKAVFTDSTEYTCFLKRKQGVACDDN